jgi:hypothetical protein
MPRLMPTEQAATLDLLTCTAGLDAVDLRLDPIEAFRCQERDPRPPADPIGHAAPAG